MGTPGSRERGPRRRGGGHHDFGEIPDQFTADKRPGVIGDPKLNALADQLEAQRAAFIGKTADPRAEVQAIVAGDKFDRARAQSLLEDKTRAVQAHSPAVVNAMADFYDSLNPDQQQKVRELMQRRKGWMARG